MSGGQIQVVEMTAAEARDHIEDLEAERLLARRNGLAHIDAYMDDLEAEIEVWRRQYVTAAVTEIATLRAELFGADLG
jgi:polyhydroxyalkanoate synthesis regulator phasin